LRDGGFEQSRRRVAVFIILSRRKARPADRICRKYECRAQECSINDGTVTKFESVWVIAGLDDVSNSFQTHIVQGLDADSFNLFKGDCESLFSGPIPLVVARKNAVLKPDLVEAVASVRF